LEVLLRSERIAQATSENHLEIYEQLGLTYTKLKDFSNAPGGRPQMDSCATVVQARRTAKRVAAVRYRSRIS
jgi:hypothetical protein